MSFDMPQSQYWSGRLFNLFSLYFDSGQGKVIKKSHSCQYYIYEVSKSSHVPSLSRTISTHETGRLESKSSSVRQKPLICFRSDIETKTQIGRYFHECQPKPHFKGRIYLPVWGIFLSILTLFYITFQRKKNAHLQHHLGATS